ncbi:zinc finger CCCH domain-containing protein 4 isoform X2 [Halyomorpha halys]|uniref:zinc finger CCCH domain-containing protein 4 isoform X2 n=1 Tax=Halyomorpha halys TaxID=286706 RepID=UPI0034D1A50A
MTNSQYTALSGGGADDLEDGEIFDDDEDLPVPTATASPPVPPPPPSISLIDDKRRLSPLRRPLPTRPRRPKRVREDDRPFRNSKQRRRSEDPEKREKNLEEDDLMRDISPLRGADWERISHRSGFMDDGMEDEDDELGRRGRGFGSSRSRRGRNNRGSRRGGGRRENTQMCKFFLQGKCQRGLECPFAHSHCQQQQTRKFELCKFYMMDCCAKKDKCLFMHSEFPCKYHYLGKKCYAGKKCKLSHGKISSQLRAALLRDSKECDFLQEKEEMSRSRRDRDRDRERDKDRDHREYRERDKREDKEKSSHNYKSDPRLASDDEEGNRTPMPSPSQDNSSDR